MSKLNTCFASFLSRNDRRFYLPRLRILGSRFLNSMVILTMLLPNLVYTVQAAVPENEPQQTRKKSVTVVNKIPSSDPSADSGYQPPIFSHPQPRKSSTIEAVWLELRTNDYLSDLYQPKRMHEVNQILGKKNEVQPIPFKKLQDRFQFQRKNPDPHHLNPEINQDLLPSSYINPWSKDFLTAYQKHQETIVSPPPAQLMQLLGEDFAEQNSSDWGADWEVDSTTIITDDFDNVFMGDASVKFDTTAGFDWWAYYPGSRQANWDLSGYTTLSFWVKTENENSAGFQTPLTVRLGDQDSGGYYQYTPTYDLYAQSSLVEGAQVSFPLSGNSEWTRSKVGPVSLSAVDYIEFHTDTWGEGYPDVDYSGGNLPLYLIGIPVSIEPEIGISEDFTIVYVGFSPPVYGGIEVGLHETYSVNEWDEVIIDFNKLRE